MSSVKQPSFSGGEIAPALYARTDQVKYATGLRTCRNFIVMRHGGATNRPGTTFRGEVKTSADVARLIPFIFNSDQTYVLEFGDLYMRVYKDGAQVTDLDLTITAITNANPGVVTYTGTDPTNGQEVYITGVVGDIASSLNGRNFKIANVNPGANTFELQDMDSVNFDTTSLGTYTSGGNAARVYEIVSPYAKADLATLNFVQSADVITFVHPTYAPRELSRTSDTSWTFTTISFVPDQAEPTSVTTSTAGSPSSPVRWAVVAVNADTGEESEASVTTTGSNTVPTSGTPASITWTLPAGNVGHYNIYRSDVATTSPTKPYGFIGVAYASGFQDNGITPDYLDNPPEARTPFNTTDLYPSTVTYYQGRIFYANTNTNTEGVWSSQSGRFHNLRSHVPITADDALTFTLSGRQVQSIKHLLDLNKLIIFTGGGEYAVLGDSGGHVTPSDINVQRYSGNGSGDIRPLLLNDTALYVQSRSNIIRDLAFNFNIDGYNGNDLTIFSTHLFEGKTIVDWDYQQVPNSIVWLARSDGTLLGLTYVKEHQMLAWHRHDFNNGSVENVVVVPEGNEDAVYVVMKRTINGSTRRYIERMETRVLTDIEDAKFVDSCLTYDGTNAAATTMTLSGGTDWLSTETLTLTSSVAAFTSAAVDVGNAVHLTGSDGELIRATITGFTSTTIVSVMTNRTVPASLQSTATAVWGHAIKTITGLWHLEGQEVSVFADGFVVGNPNNASIATSYTVSSGSITLDRPYQVIQIGLPITADLETLDIDTASGESIADKGKLINRNIIITEKTRGLWAGAAPPSDDSTDPLENLDEYKLRDSETYEQPSALTTDRVEINMQGKWSKSGRVFIRQVDPVPASVLAIIPAGLVPYPRQG